MNRNSRVVLGIVGALVLLMGLGVMTAGKTTAASLEGNQAESSGDLSPFFGKEIAVSELEVSEYSPAVAYNWKHDEYFVVWDNNWVTASRDIRAARIARDGTVLGTYTIFDDSTHDAKEPSVAYDPVNDRYLVVWMYDYSGHGTDWDIYSRLVPWNGPVSAVPAKVVYNATNNQTHPKVVYARTPQEFYVVWEENASGTHSSLTGRRIKASNGMPATTGTNTTISHASHDLRFPDVAYNMARNEYLVVYDDGNDVYAKRLKNDGTILGAGLGVAGWPGKEEHAAVAACALNNQYVVAWQSDQNSGNEAIYARYIDGDGTIRGVYKVDDTTSPEIEPDVACQNDGRTYLFVWQTRFTNLKYGVYARFADKDAQMTSQFPVVNPSTNRGRQHPAVAGGNVNFMVAWEHAREGSNYIDIHGKIITQYQIFVPSVMK